MKNKSTQNNLKFYDFDFKIQNERWAQNMSLIYFSIS